MFLSLTAGLVTIFVSVLLILWALLTKIMGISVPGASGILIAIGFFSGMILTTIGIIGIYVANLLSSKRAPSVYI